MKFPARILVIFGLLALYTSSPAQDIIRLMQYNLLMYGDDFGGCNQSNNNISDKNNYFRDIIAYLQPDLISVNELGCEQELANGLLDEAVNMAGYAYFRMSPISCLSTPYLTNLVFYNEEKLSLYSSEIITTWIRDINVNTFYLNTSELPQSHDTIFFSCISAHLKAGSDASNETERAYETATLMEYLENHPLKGHAVIMGDLNLYSASEQAYQNLTACSGAVCFKDPLDEEGNWHSNSSYREIHTQSTHDQTNGCPSGGGLDDRFDFILMSSSLFEATAHLKYISGSYTVPGNDGEHFNEAINDYPQNTSVPDDILTALYNMSDHLPVMAELEVDKDLPSNLSQAKHKIINAWAIPEKLNIRLDALNDDMAHIRLSGLDGKEHLHAKRKIHKGENLMEYNLRGLSPAMYILSIHTSGSGTSLNKKVVIR